MKKTLDTKKYKYQLSASLICANPLDIRKDIVSLEEGGIDSIHFDVMDGNFVPRLGLYPELLKSVKSITKLPIHVHLMIDDPVMFTPVFAEFGASSILVHYESCKHVHYAINQINSFGIKSGIILNYSTPLNTLDYLLEDLDIVALMAINPGIVGHKIIPGVIKKIADLRRIIDESGRKVVIEIDGGVNIETAPKMIKSGANSLVCGTSSIFKKDVPLNKSVMLFRKSIERNLLEES